MIVTVRPFELDADLERACDFGQRAREQDAAVEPFAQRLPVIASGPRALLELWRVAEGEDGRFHGLSFGAVREARRRKPAKAEARSPILAGLSAPEITEPIDNQLAIEVYGAVDLSLRRQGLGRQLFEPLTQLALGAPGTTLRARVRAPSAGEKFLPALGFRLSTAQLSLARSGPAPRGRESPGVLVKPLDRKDKKSVDAFRKLSNDAWTDAPDAFETRADELEQLLSDLGRLVLFGELEGKTAGYLSGVFLGKALAIEEVAVLPRYRRFGVGHALVVAALQRSPAALLTVSEKNAAARQLYKGLGFAEASRRTVWELRA